MIEVVTGVAGELATALLTRLGLALGSRALQLTQGPPAGGTPEQRFVAYERLRRECVGLRTTLDILWSVPVRLPGAVVSLPLHLRLLRRLPQQGAEVNDAFLGLAMVGEREVVDSATALAKALQGVSTTMGKQRSGRRGHADQARPDWTEFDAALQTFVFCCRRDLGIEALPHQQ